MKNVVHYVKIINQRQIKLIVISSAANPYSTWGGGGDLLILAIFRYWGGGMILKFLVNYRDLSKGVARIFGKGGRYLDRSNR